jgi:glycosyltransferase involved in cell wall biosynthesis
VTLPFEEPQAKATDAREFTVAYVGRLIPEKGVDVAIRAIAEARRQGSSVRLEVIGDGPELPVLQELAQRELPDSLCVFVGALNPDLALARMGLADAVIVPSVWSEPAGFVVLEAMALGVPVIATDAGGIPEIARGAALLAARSDAAAFARVIAELASDPTRFQAMVGQGKAIATVHSAEHMTTQYIELYGRLLRRPMGDATIGLK